MEITLTTDNFRTEVQEASVPVLVDFWAEWCMPCKVVEPVLHDLATEYDGKLKVGKVNVDECPELAGEFNVVSIPTMLLFKDGRVVEQHIGAAPKTTFAALIEPYL